jgi:hypothetical protein
MVDFGAAFELEPTDNDGFVDARSDMAASLEFVFVS